ncbi:MAG TPA: DNA internalization-related competence protein ComEC/Rec2, partial [Burkholderiaceae bacterium]
AEPAPQGWRAHLQAGWRAQWIATLGLAPLSLLFFQQISLVGLLANLIAIPLVSLVITPLALAGAVLPLLWQWDVYCIDLLHAVLRGLQSLPGAVQWLPVAPLWAQGLGLLGGVLAVLPLPWRVRVCAPLLALGLLWPAVPRPLEGVFELIAPDVGQGMAVWVRTRRHSLLFDAGPQWGPRSDAGQRVLLPLLRARGEARLDVLLLSHRDADHVGGAASLLAAEPVAELLSSLAPGHPLLAQVPNRRCEAGQQWQWDGVHFEVLAPTADDYLRANKSNAVSCVLRIVDAAGHAALLAGDIEATQELALLARAQTVRSEMLLVPHHGSKTSSTEAFLRAVGPRLALVQAGYRNRFGHPALAVMARYQALGITVFESPSCGAWTWASADASPQCQRELGRRYWHERQTRRVPADRPDVWDAGAAEG